MNRNAVNTLKNGGLVDSIYESFQEFYTTKKFMQRTIVCQIYQLKIAQQNAEILEIILSNSQQLVKAKIFKSILAKCARKVNENIVKEIMILRGSFISITDISFEPVKGGTSVFDIFINDFYYIDYMNGPIINAHSVDKQTPILIAPYSDYEPFKRLLMPPKSLVYDTSYSKQSNQYQVLFNKFANDMNFKPAYKQERRVEDTDTMIVQKSL